MDTCSDENKRGSRQGRRHHGVVKKRRIVEEALHSGDSVSVVARRHNVNANQLFKWRRDYLHGLLGGAPATGSALVPIQISAPVATTPRPRERTSGSALEILLRDGHRVTLRGSVDTEALRVALEVLSR